MNIHVTRWYCQMTHKLYMCFIFIQIFVKQRFWAISIYFMTKNAVFCRPTHTTRVKRSIWIQYILVNVHVAWIFINNYPDETELDTNPSLTPAQTLTPSTGERSLGNFTSCPCYDTTNFNFAFVNSPCNLGKDPESRNGFYTKNHSCMKLTPKEQMCRE